MEVNILFTTVDIRSLHYKYFAARKKKNYLISEVNKLFQSYRNICFEAIKNGDKSEWSCLNRGLSSSFLVTDKYKLYKIYYRLCYAYEEPCSSIKNLSIYLSKHVQPSIQLSISVYVCMYVCMYVSIYLSIYKNDIDISCTLYFRLLLEVYVGMCKIQKSDEFSMENGKINEPQLFSILSMPDLSLSLSLSLYIYIIYIYIYICMLIY